MDTLENNPVAQEQSRRRLPWHKPEIQCLEVNCYTAQGKQGSFEDAEFGSRVPLPP